MLTLILLGLLFGGCYLAFKGAKTALGNSDVVIGAGKLVGRLFKK